jgi:hypothetical protein
MTVDDDLVFVTKAIVQFNDGMPRETKPGEYSICDPEKHWLYFFISDMAGFQDNNKKRKCHL